MLLMIPLLACRPEPTPDPVVTVRETARVQSSALPVAGWDPIFLDVALVDEVFEDGVLVERTEEELRPAEPTVLDAEGKEVALEPTAFHAYEYGWRGVEPLAPGAYTIVQADGRPMTPMSFTVREHGQTAVVPEVGAVYRLDGVWMPEVGAAVGGVLEDAVWLEVLDLQEGALRFRVLAEQDYLCEFFVGWGELSEDGVLRFALDELVANEGEAPFAAYELRLQVGFGAEGSELAGGEVEAVIDTRGLDAGTDWDICEILPGFGVECEACPDDGEAECLPLAGRAARLSLDDVSFDQRLPACGVDLSDAELPTIDFDCSGTSCAATGGQGWPWVGSILALVVAGRRRRSAGEETPTGVFR